MIVKLKCVDTCGCDYFTTEEIYIAIEIHGDNCYSVVNNDGYESIISTDDKNNFHGKWEIVE